MGDIKPLTPGQLGKTLVDQLSPMVQELRQLATDFGLRRYRVFVVREQWSGARRGEGDATVSQQVELLPTPKVEGVANVRKSASEGGQHQQGVVTVSKIAMHSAYTGRVGYTEDDLLGNAVSRPLADNERVYYLVSEDGGTVKLTSDEDPAKWRYRLASTPQLHSGGCEWILKLVKVEQDTTE